MDNCDSGPLAVIYLESKETFNLSFLSIEIWKKLGICWRNQHVGHFRPDNR